MSISYLKALSFVPAFLIMYMIFSLSSQTADTSSQLSLGISTEIVITVDHILSADLDQPEIETWAQRIHNYVRKTAHFTEYFLLGLALAFPLYIYRLKGKLLFFVSSLSCMFFACSDEFHQAFISGRSQELRDVCIDTLGSITGILLFLFISRIISRWYKKHQR